MSKFSGAGGRGPKSNLGGLIMIVEIRLDICGH